MRLVGLTTILCIGLVSVANAQPRQAWLIVPAVIGEEPEPPTTARLRLELTKRGVDVWSAAGAAERFEKEGSAPAPELDAQAIDEWDKGANQVLENLVRGTPKRALEELRRGDLLSQDNATVLNRDPSSAQKLLDTCLLGVRALLETRPESEAVGMVQRCRQLSVRGGPTPRMHPPAVLALLERVDTDRARATGALAVDSEPVACTVRINGLEVGKTPLVHEPLPPGRYLVQVECDPSLPGRVHVAEVGSEVTEVFVEVGFQRRVVTRPSLVLRYPDDAAREQHLEADAARVLSAVPAETIVTVSPSATVSQVIASRGTPLQTVASAKLETADAGSTRDAVSTAVAALLDGQCLDLTMTPPITSPCNGVSPQTAAPRPVTEHPHRRPRGQFISGLTLVGVGGASLLTAYVLTAPRARASEDWVAALDAGTPSASSQEKWFNQGVAIKATGAVGAGVLTAAMPLVLPNREKTPWWAWVSGGIGIGLAAFAIGYGVGAEPEPAVGCSNLVSDSADARTCVKRAERIDTAVLTGVTAAPLITIPLVYLLRRNDRAVAPEVVASRRGAFVGVRGEF